MSKQILKSGTSIGANLREAKNAQSDLDFIHKNAIAQKNATENIILAKLLRKTDFISEENFVNLSSKSNKLLKIIKFYSY